jgi:hypothetical protein
MFPFPVPVTRPVQHKHGSSSILQGITLVCCNREEIKLGRSLILLPWYCNCKAGVTEWDTLLQVAKARRKEKKLWENIAEGELLRTPMFRRIQEAGKQIVTQIKL